MAMATDSLRLLPPLSSHAYQTSQGNKQRNKEGHFVRKCSRGRLKLQLKYEHLQMAPRVIPIFKPWVIDLLPATH